MVNRRLRRESHGKNLLFEYVDYPLRSSKISKLNRSLESHVKVSLTILILSLTEMSGLIQ
jgi:hypothetical protein